MPGSSYQAAIESYAAFFKESTFGTYPATAATGATFIEFMSNSFKTEIESKKLETLGHRSFVKRVQLNKNVSGALETYLHPIESVVPLANALGGPLVSSSLTGAYTHSISAGHMNTTTAINSLSFNVQKGETAFEYVGGRVNTMKITAKINEPVSVSYEIIFKDSTQGAFGIGSSMTLSTTLPFTFANGVFRYAATEAAAATTTAEEPVIGFELSINNQLVTDETGRQLGSNVLSVLPPTRKVVELTTTQRFDTTTAYSRFIQATQGAIELKFTGAAITAEHNNAMTIRLPKVYNNTPDPELGSPSEILVSEMTWDVVADTGTTAGKEIGVTVINNVASY